PGRWGVKDSFAELALAPLGFGVLFDAAWLWRAAPGGAAEGSGRVRDADTLARWEAAWGGGGTPRHETFPPALLEDPAVALLAAQEGGAVVAGAAAYAADGVVGLTNAFLVPGAPRRRLHSVLEAAGRAFPGLPLGGYAHGEELAAWEALGFTRAGPLRVWLKEAAPARRTSGDPPDTPGR
ncbi:MAG TPA: hypothetical protein VK420_12860, partial [Longimicrobium sp.]|nr:hypothetical protein [Longimicrobium sp.]